MSCQLVTLLCSTEKNHVMSAWTLLCSTEKNHDMSACDIIVFYREEPCHVSL